MHDYVEHGASILAQRGILKDDVLMHHGIIGQRKGRRRWQNKDGSLTPEGYIHYGYGLPDKDKERDYWQGLPDKSSGRYSSGSTSGSQTHDDDYYERYEGDVEGEPESRKRDNQENQRQYDDIDADYREYDDEPSEQNDGNNTSSDKNNKKKDNEPWMNQDLYKQYKTVQEQNKFDEEVKKWKNNHPDPPTKGQKVAAGLNTVGQTINTVAGNNGPLSAIAENDTKKKQSKARLAHQLAIQNLSNDDLQAVINRRRLERQYLDENTPYVESGYDKTMKLLNVVGGVATTTAAVIGVAEMVKKMKG